MRAAATALALLLAVVPGGVEARCKLALVLGLDVSSSVNSREYAIQLGGLVAAFRTEVVIDAILAPPRGGIAAMAFEWSGIGHQAEIAPWTRLDSEAAITAFADRLEAHGRTASDGATAIGSALAHAARAFRAAPDCARRTIDISGDGETNEGPSPLAVRAAGLLEGITVNGLVIQGAYPNPAIHYRAEVMHGPDAFVALARDFTDYPPVIIGKLLEEIGVPAVLGRVE